MSRIFGLKLISFRNIRGVSYYGPLKREPVVGDVLTVEDERGYSKTVTIAHEVERRVNKKFKMVSSTYSIDVSRNAYSHNPGDRRWRSKIYLLL